MELVFLFVCVCVCTVGGARVYMRVCLQDCVCVPLHTPYDHYVCVYVSRENEVGMFRLVLYLIVCTVQYVCVCGGGG